MNINIYRASLYKEIMDGGSSKPWLIDVETLHGIQPFVVKIYKEQHIKENNSVLKELVMAHLANEFELCTPEYALIEFDKHFLSTLNEKCKKQLKTAYKGYKFGTKLISPNYQYNNNKSLEKEEYYQLATIYAFDFLMENVDRSTSKPNLFFDNKEQICLIDHELSMNFLDQERVNFNYQKNKYNFINHIFFKRLSNAKQNKKELFDTFEYFLNKLNIESLKKFEITLKQLNFDVKFFFRIQKHLQFVKQNSSEFIDVLIKSLAK